MSLRPLRCICSIDASPGAAGATKQEFFYSVFERHDVMAVIAAQIRQQTTGPMANCLRHALRYPSIDKHLPRVAAAAILKPLVRAAAYQCLISGKASWSVGFEWAWIDKAYGVRRRIEKLATREVQSAGSAANLIREAAHDKSPVVRRVAADALIAAQSRLPDEETLLAHLAERSKSVDPIAGGLQAASSAPGQSPVMYPVLLRLGAILQDGTARLRPIHHSPNSSPRRSSARGRVPPPIQAVSCDMQHGDGGAEAEQAKAAIGDHGGGRAATDARMQDQHHAGEDHRKQRQRAADIRTDPARQGDDGRDRLPPAPRAAGYRTSAG